MNLLYLDGAAGISGNMFLGGLIDLGLPVEVLNNELKRLPIPLPELCASKVKKRGISATYFEVKTVPEEHHRHLSAIIDLIEATGFKTEISEKAKNCFRKLAEAEAKIHGVTPETIHFHEVGAMDAIVDIVGTCIGLEYFQVGRILVSPLRMGFGFIECAHGKLPLPAPASAELLLEFNSFGGEYEGEWTTPTGAALVATLAETCEALPAMQVKKIGYGAGLAEREIPNVLRIFYGRDYQPSECKDFPIQIETNIDDMNPELYGALGSKLLNAGAKDYFFTSVIMKKGRPGLLITVLAEAENVTEIEKVLFTETTTFGVRKQEVRRRCLAREELQVMVAGYLVRVKVANFEGEVLKYAPEYEDCLKAATGLNRSLLDVYQEAQFAARNILKK